MCGEMFCPFLYGCILFGTPRHSPTYRTAEFQFRFFFANRNPGYIGLQACFTESVSTRKTFWFFYRLQTNWTIKRHIFTNSFPFHRHCGCFDENTLQYGTFVLTLRSREIGGSRLSNEGV